MRTFEDSYSIEDFIDSKTILTLFLGSWVPQRFFSHGVTKLAFSTVWLRLGRVG